MATDEFSYPAAGRVGRVIKNSAIISIFNALGFATALLIDIIITANFGLGQETDAFFIAFSVPQFVTSVLLVAPNVALVPFFTRIALAEDRDKLWRVVSNLLNIGLLALGSIGALGALSTPLLVSGIGAGLDPETRHLAITLSPWLFLMVVPVGAIEILKAALNTLQSFAFPAATAAIRNTITFLAVLLFGKTLGIQALVWGYVVGAWGQLIFLAIVLFFKGFRYHPILDLSDVQAKQALQQLRYPVMGAVLGQSNVLVERFFASFLPLGMVSALVYARRILRAVESVFVGSITTALLPRLSNESAQKGGSEFRNSLILGVKLTTILAMPVALGIIALSVPMVQLLFQRGAFDTAAVQATARLLAIYILTIPPDALYQLLAASYYATGDTQNPFYFRLLLLGLCITLDFVLFWKLGGTGLALSYALSRFIIVFVVGWGVSRQIRKFLDKALLTFLAKIGTASVVMMGIVLWLRGRDFVVEGSISLMGQVLWIEGMICVGALVYVLLLVGLRVKEIAHFSLIMRQRLLRKEERLF